MKKKNRKDKAKEGIDFIENNIHCFVPEIIWPTFDDSSCSRRVVEHDEDSFQGIGRIKNNYDVFKRAKEQGKELPGSSKFWACFRNSYDITLVDKKFDAYCFDRIFSELKKIYKLSNTILDNFEKDIYICCESYYGDVRSLNEQYRNSEFQIYNKVKIVVNQIPEVRYIHDRFAIMDKEIWHCGSTVGGMHEKMTVLTRGWPDVDNRLRDFFREVKYDKRSTYAEYVKQTY